MTKPSGAANMTDDVLVQLRIAMSLSFRGQAAIALRTMLSTEGDEVNEPYGPDMAVDRITTC